MKAKSQPDSIDRWQQDPSRHRQGHRKKTATFSNRSPAKSRFELRCYNLSCHHQSPESLHPRISSVHAKIQETIDSLMPVFWHPYIKNSQSILTKKNVLAADEYLICLLSALEVKPIKSLWFERRKSKTITQACWDDSGRFNLSV